MNIEAMHMPMNNVGKKPSSKEILSTVNELGSGQGSPSKFITMLGNVLQDESIVNQTMDNLASIQEGRPDEGVSTELNQLLTILLNDIPNSEAYLSKEMLKTPEIKSLLNLLPKELVEKIESLFNQGISIDTLVDSSDLTQDHAQFLAVLITLAQKDTQAIHSEIDKPLIKHAEKLFPFIVEQQQLGKKSESKYESFPITRARNNDYMVSLSKGSIANQQLSFIGMKLNNHEPNNTAQSIILRLLDTIKGQTLRVDKSQIQSVDTEIFIKQLSSLVNGSAKQQDVLKSISSQLNIQTVDKSPVSSQVFTGINSAMNPVQQMVIHVGEQNTQLGSQQQFIRQFQEVLGRGSLMNFKNGNSQLSIKLYPEHLGRLDVQLSQVNGAIIARIMTSSSTARELVESQLQQLRQAFVGQQLNVERIEISQQQLGQSFKEQNSNHSEQESSEQEREKNDRKREDESTFAEFLEELTINEKA